MTPQTFMHIYDRIVPDERGCRVWPTLASSDKYAGVVIDGYGRGHRGALSLKLGRPLADDMKALHTCDVRGCLCMDHLYEGTSKQNTADMLSRDRHAAPGSPGETHHSAVLTDRRVMAIRRMAEMGYRYRNLAKLFGIQEDTVGQIVRRRTWRHV